MIPSGVNVEEFEKAESLDGKLGSSDESSLMKTVMENDSKEIEDGKVINDMNNQGLNSFQPDITFEQLVTDYKNAQNIYGKSLLRELTGYSAEQIQRNIKIPEFQQQLKAKLHAKSRQLEKEGLLSANGEILSEGMNAAALNLCLQELDDLKAKGLSGEHEHKLASKNGERYDVRNFKKTDSYKDIDVRASVKRAIRRGNTKMSAADLQTSMRHARGNLTVVFALDSSGSMRGNKINAAKKAGVALCYKATQNKDKVGIIIFSDKIELQVDPTTEFDRLLTAITKIKAAAQTDIAKILDEAHTMFADDASSKHLVLLTDAQSSVGDDPKKKVFEAVSKLRAQNITVSLIGIELDKEYALFAQELVSIGGGKLYIAEKIDDLDSLVLHDYEQMRS